VVERASATPPDPQLFGQHPARDASKEGVPGIGCNSVFRLVTKMVLGLIGQNVLRALRGRDASLAFQGLRSFLAQPLAKGWNPSRDAPRAQRATPPSTATWRVAKP
jgi:hypothetical protein